MLKLLTKKLKSQSLNEERHEQPEDADDEERDSGTESDENFDDDIVYGSNTSLNDPVLNCNNSHGICSRANSSSGARLNGSCGVKTHEINEHDLDTISCTSDYERHGLNFDRHSSEDELVTISKENVAEKRKWSQVHQSGFCDSSSDDEVKEFLLNPQPVLLSSMPPRGVHKVKVFMRPPSWRPVLPCMPPIILTSVSPRKRHKRKAAVDMYNLESGSRTQRPCLNFEKMQQVQTFV